MNNAENKRRSHRDEEIMYDDELADVEVLGTNTGLISAGVAFGMNGGGAAAAVGGGVVGDSTADVVFSILTTDTVTAASDNILPGHCYLQ